MPNAWIIALKKWNEGKDKWCMPRKGSKGHTEILKIMGKKKDPKAPKPKAPKPKAPKPKAPKPKAPKPKAPKPQPTPSPSKVFVFIPNEPLDELEARAIKFLKKKSKSNTLNHLELVKILRTPQIIHTVINQTNVDINTAILEGQLPLKIQIVISNAIREIKNLTGIKIKEYDKFFTMGANKIDKIIKDRRKILKKEKDFRLFRENPFK